jgi:hypothetical protein
MTSSSTTKSPEVSTGGTWNILLMTNGGNVALAGQDTV